MFHKKESWKKSISLFLLSQTITLLGSALVQFAITWYITLETGSGIMMTISTVCGFLPAFFLSPFAGVWADRYNRKMLIIFADAFIAIATLGLFFSFFFGYDAIWLLFLISIVRSIGNGIQTPAVSAMIPQLVPKEELSRINGIYGSIQPVVSLGAPLLSGILLASTGIRFVFLIDVITAIIGISLFFFFVKVPTHEKALQKEKNSYFSDMGSGLMYIIKSKKLLILFFFCIAYFLFLAPAAMLTTLQVVRLFGEDVMKLTFVEVSFSVGMVLSGIFIAVKKNFSDKIRVLSISSIAFAFFAIGLGLSSDFSFYLVFMALCGTTVPFINTAATVYLQEKTNEAFHGRIFGILTMLSCGLLPLSMLAWGPLSDRVSISVLLIVSGIAMLTFAVALFFNKTLSEKKHQMPEP